MIAESLRSQIKALSTDERHELAGFLAKLELESDEDYWERVRRRMADGAAEKWLPADQI
ncbi:MAG: hypothetical protein KA152_18005 [Verrucomicrobiales bacterium]|nr:hypothetical protein [Verrucomicrobiales bacterium]